MKKIKIVLADLLVDRGLTQAQLAEKADIRPNAISNLTRGYVDRLSIDHLEKLANALEIDDIREIITIVDDKKDAQD